METTAQEIIKTIQTFPIALQKEIIRSLQNNLKKSVSAKPTEDEIEKMLLAKGVIAAIPHRKFDAAQDSYEPIEISGPPLSETILEERE